MSGDPALVLECEADDAGAILSAITEWDDVLDLSSSAITAEQGLTLAKQMAPA